MGGMMQAWTALKARKDPPSQFLRGFIYATAICVPILVIAFIGKWVVG